ncbi:glycine receptor subunit alpha-2-like protein, partial [Leptotrombidium deliense]
MCFAIRNADLPITVNGSVLDIDVAIKFMDISSIKLLDMEYRLDFFLTFEWKVHRKSCDAYIAQLIYNKITNNKPIAGDEYLVRGFEALKIWKPDIYIPEMKKHESPTISGNTYFIMILVESNETCHMRYDSRAAAIFSCQYNFRSYPYDKQ